MKVCREIYRCGEDTLIIFSFRFSVKLFPPFAYIVQFRAEVNKMAELGTQLAHVDGGVPNMRIVLPELSEYNIGGLLYFFEKACGISGYLLGVNPFNQPGVEAYKKNMFALLDKPGYEEESKAIRAKL